MKSVYYSLLDQFCDGFDLLITSTQGLGEGCHQQKWPSHAEICKGLGKMKYSVNQVIK